MGSSGRQESRRIGFERVERRVQCTHAVLELLDDVFLAAAVVGLGDDLVLAQRPVVGDVEEVPEVSADAELAALFLDELAEHNDAVGGFGPPFEVSRRAEIQHSTGAARWLVVDAWDARRAGDLRLCRAVPKEIARPRHVAHGDRCLGQRCVEGVRRVETPTVGQPACTTKMDARSGGLPRRRTTRCASGSSRWWTSSILLACLLAAPGTIGVGRQHITVTLMPAANSTERARVPASPGRREPAQRAPAGRPEPAHFAVSVLKWLIGRRDL